MSWSTWVLLYGMLEFRDGYEAAGQKDMACDMIRTPLEYFLKCWIPDQQTLYVQVCFFAFVFVVFISTFIF